MTLCASRNASPRSLRADVDQLAAIAVAYGAVVGLLVVERVSAGARAVQYRVERDSAQTQADRMRLELVHLARDIARMREAACRCHADDIVRMADAADQRIDGALGNG